MKKIIVLSFICILFALPAYGEDDELDNAHITVPPGMETVKKGDVNLLIYKGSRTRKENDVSIPETPDEYATRKFTDADDRFKKLENELGIQKKDLEALKAAVKKLEEDERKWKKEMIRI